MSGPQLDNVEDVYPLTPMQEGMLFHSITAPGTGVFVDQIACRLEGGLDEALFVKAWEVLVGRHPVLRTAFLWDGLDEPLQVVRGAVEVPWATVDWTDADDAERDRRLAALLHEDRHRDFDLADAPLVRMQLVRETATQYRWLWTFHHLVLDGWSASVVVRELLTIYEALGRGEAPVLDDTLPYRDYIAWHARQDGPRAERFWRGRLDGFETPIQLPGSGAGGAGHAQHEARLGVETSEVLRSVAAAQRVTLSAVVQGAWALLLGQWTRERDVVFGVTTSGRPPELFAIERAVGLFINTMPMRVAVDAAAPVGEWLRSLQRDQLEMRDVEYSPLASIQRWSDVSPGASLFESIVVFENYPQGPALEAGGMRITGMEFHEQSNYPLALLVLPRPSLGVTFVYDAARFEPGTIAWLADRLLALLDRLATGGADGRVGDLLRPDPAEQRRLLVDWNETDAPSAEERLVHELFEAAAASRPDATAVAFGEQSLSYGELDRAANRVAARVRAFGLEPDARVGIYAPRSLEMVVGILGILKAGAAYVPLDPGYPRRHVERLVEASAPGLLLAPPALVDELPGTGIEGMAIEVDTAPGDDAVARPAPATTPDALAYVIFTSGSTGVPKGVMVSHRNLVHSTTARERFYPAGVGRFLLLSSFSFDSSVAGIFWTLCTGGALVLPAPGLEQDMERLLALLHDEAVTHLLCLPALYGLLLEHAAPGQLDTLDTAIVAGEACPVSLLARHAEAAPNAQLYNEYGPTEVTVWSVAHRLDAAETRRTVPIGRPIANTRAYVLDELGSLVPPGFAGELHLAGAGVARGYLDDDELTAQRFVTRELPGEPPRRMYRTGDLVRHRDDGALEFLGRADAQVKIRGHRIERAAVEAALRTLPDVTDAAARAWVDKRSGTAARNRLVGYVVPSDGASRAEPAELRTALAASVPAFMVPDSIIVLPALPRTANGKTDYRALPAPAEPSRGAVAAAAPGSEAERTLAAIWSELLGVDAVGVHDNFFQLGGDSILSIQMISRARQQGLGIEPRQIADHPTVAELASVAGPVGAGLVEEEEATGPFGLAPIQSWFFGLGLAAPGHWNQSGLFEVAGTVDASALDDAWQACVAHHDMLRARFVPSGNEWRQEIVALDDVDAGVRVIDLSGMDDERMVEAELARAQASLDLGRAPLAEAVLFRRANGAGARLALLVHHLVIDVVSWAILLDDLETAYDQRLRNEPIALAPRTTSYRRWTELLAGLVDDPRLQAERASWLAPAGAGDVPIDHDGRAVATERTARSVRSSLDVNETQALLGEVHEAYRTRPEDLIVAALARTLSRWTGRTGVRVELEHHGRPDDVEGVDLSRTVGWFTTSYPVTLAAHRDDAGQLVRETKEALRRVPAQGRGYGVLRYLEPAGGELATGAPDVLLNYLGRQRTAGAVGTLRRVDGLERSSRDPDNARTHAIEVLAVVRDDRLVVDWVYSDALHRPETIERIAGWFHEELAGLVRHCLGSDGGQYTPSDFPEADLDQAELDEFLDSLD